jgi:hypothetical protein
MKLRHLRPDEVIFTVNITNDLDTPVKSTVHANGEYLSVDIILERVRSGDRYAWFTATVTASWHNLIAPDWKWGISFENGQAFLASDTYGGMKTKALERLQYVLEEKFKAVAPLIEKNAG